MWCFTNLVELFLIKKIKELLTPFGKDTLSHWDKEDKMVIVPEHLNNYVEKNYGEVYVYVKVPYCPIIT